MGVFQVSHLVLAYGWGMEADRGPQGEARDGDRAVRGDVVQETVKERVEVREHGEGRHSGGFRHQLPADLGRQGRTFDQEI